MRDSTAAGVHVRCKAAARFPTRTCARTLSPSLPPSLPSCLSLTCTMCGWLTTFSTASSNASRMVAASLRPPPPPGPSPSTLTATCDTQPHIYTHARAVRPRVRRTGVCAGACECHHRAQGQEHSVRAGAHVCALVSACVVPACVVPACVVPACVVPACVVPACAPAGSGRTSMPSNTPRCTVPKPPLPSASSMVKPSSSSALWGRRLGGGWEEVRGRAGKQVVMVVGEQVGTRLGRGLEEVGKRWWVQGQSQACLETAGGRDGQPLLTGQAPMALANTHAPFLRLAPLTRPAPCPQPYAPGPAWESDQWEVSDQWGESEG